MAKLIVTVPKNEDGTPKHSAVKVSAKNPEYSSILLKASVIRMSKTKTGGFIMDESSRAAYLQLKSSVANALNLTEGVDINSLGLNLTIARKETREPQYEGHQPKINPSTSEVILVDGAPVYLTDYVAPAGTQDQLITSSTAVAEQAPTVQEQGAMS